MQRGDLYIDHGNWGARAPRPQFHHALDVLRPGDTLVITTLDRLSRPTESVLRIAEELQRRKAELRMLNLAGQDVDTTTLAGSTIFTIMTALARMEHDVKSERVTDSISRRHTAGQNLGGRPQQFNDDQIRNALQLIQHGDSTKFAAQQIGVSKATLYRRLRELAH